MRGQGKRLLSLVMYAIQYAHFLNTNVTEWPTHLLTMRIFAWHKTINKTNTARQFLPCGYIQ